MNQQILIHYGEIGLKGGNKDYFVEKLRNNIVVRLQERLRQTVSVVYSIGRIIVKLPENFEKQIYIDVLSKIFGIKNFSFVHEGSTDLERLGQEIFEKLELEGVETFCVRVKRSMDMDFSSVEAEREVGAILLRKGIEKRVKMKNPDLEINVEFMNQHGYFSFKKYPGQGGFPANSQSRLVSMISAGIDSPVAAFRMMRRGARIIFMHFHGYPHTDKDEMEQVKELVKILSDYQFSTRLLLVPFGKIQKDIAMNLEVPGRLRTILYRRMMLRITEKFALQEGARGIVTGDSFGQVASQTPDNIAAIHEASRIPLFQPLIAYDKEEIVKMAEEIGTYEISKLPCKDTCAMFQPKNPELKAKISEVQDLEKNLPINGWIKEALSEPEVIDFN